MVTYTKDKLRENLNMAMVYTVTKTEIIMREIGKMINKMAMVFINFPMELSIKDNFQKDNQRVKEYFNIHQYNMMI